MRANAVTGIIERNRVWLPFNKQFAAELLAEALEFPRGAHDDAVDAMTTGLLYFRKRYEITQEEVSKPDTYAPSRRRKSYWRSMNDVRAA